MPIDDELRLYIGIPGKLGDFYEYYEDFFYPPKAGGESPANQLLRGLKNYVCITDL